MPDTTQKMPEKLLEFAQKHLGIVKTAKARGWKHQETGVWELETEQGRVFLKNHRQAVKFDQELRVFQEVLPYVLKVTPSLLAYDKLQHTMLLSAVPGELVDDLIEQQNIHNRELEIYYQAGQFLRSYHGAPYEDTEPPSLEEAFWLRSESWLARAKPYVALRDIEWVREKVREMLPALRVLKRVPCHRDYTGRNWLWHDKLYVIDFEHSRPDVWLVDLERLMNEVWPTSPELKEAFLSGYGRTLTVDDEALAFGNSALTAITRIVWSLEHDDQDYAEMGRKILEHLKTNKK
jgi:Ser/Thr protein kinase RdoA (MazF antagonist)